MSAAIKETVKTFTRPVIIDGWLCNGGIDPLIRDVQHLKQVAGDTYAEAVRYAAIDLECHAMNHVNPERVKAHMEAGELDAVAKVYFEWRGTPVWSRNYSPEFMHKGQAVYTAAQALAIFHNYDCRALCADLADCCRAFELEGSYNELDAPEVVRWLRHFNVRLYYNTKNPNNGGDLFKYLYGHEGSTVLYIQCNFYGATKMLDRKGETEADFTREDFEVVCQALARRCKCDESNLVSSPGSQVQEWRLWWD